MKTIAMKCASCGAGLQIAPDMGQFACGYCGASLNVVRQGGAVALRIVVDSIARVKVGTDRTAAELALVRLPKDIEERRRELDAMDKKISYLEAEIHKASLPSRSRIISIIVDQTLGAIGFGIVRGLFLGFFVGCFFHAWLPVSIGVYVGLFVAVVHAVGYFSDPMRVRARGSARFEDHMDKSSRYSAPLNAERLPMLQKDKGVIKDRLQKLNGQVAAARAIVDQ